MKEKTEEKNVILVKNKKAKMQKKTKNKNTKNTHNKETKKRLIKKAVGGRVGWGGSECVMERLSAMK